MIFEKVKCSHCQKDYDKTLAICPYCHEQNLRRGELNISTRMLWLPLIRQILLFLLGWAGLKLFSLIISLSLTTYAAIIYDGNKELMAQLLSRSDINMYVNTLIYLVLFLGIFLIIIPYFKNIAIEFKSLKRWLKGFSYGALLIGASIALNLIIRSFMPNNGNDNQQNLDSMIPSFPFLSILIFGIIGPIVEEFTYRVGLFNFLSRFNRVVAYIFTILIFALIHFNFNSSTPEGWINELINLPSYVLAALILCYAYERDGLVSSMSAHVLNNLVSVISVIIASHVV